MIYHPKLLPLIVTIVVDAAAGSSTAGETWASLSDGSFFKDNGGLNVNHRELSSFDFIPLSCNNEADLLLCDPWPFGTDTGAVEIPCNTCYNMGVFTGGEYIRLTGPLDIKGKLDFPDGTRVTIETTGIIVQGELAMTSTKEVNGIPDIVIKFTGSDDVYFRPHSDNRRVCESGSDIEEYCNLGVKPFVVAGGKLNINGLPDSCPVWTTVVDFETDELSGKPNPIDFPKQPTLPIPTEGTCETTLLKETFEGGTGIWYGNVGANEETLSGSHDGSQYLHISRRTATFQGPLYDMDISFRECIIPNTIYFFQAKLRISASDGVSSSKCSSLSENCPKLQIGYLTEEDELRWRVLDTFVGVDFDDNVWYDVKSSFQFVAEYVSVDNIFSAFLVDGPEPGINISIDDIHIYLPPIETYPDPDDVCGDLIQNGDAQQPHGFAAPMYSFIKSNTIIIQDEGTNKYFSIKNRKAKNDSLAVSLTTKCLVEGSIYSFSMRIKIDSDVKVIPRVITKTHTGTDIPIFNIVATCPGTSIEIGWITCVSDFIFLEHHFTSPKVELLVYLPEDATSDVHYDDISFTFHCGNICPMSLTDDPYPCWAPGAEVIFPSETLLFDATTITTLETIRSGGVITTPSNAVDPPPTTAAKNPHTAGEIGLLSRNILFENFENILDDSTAGPSLVILRTPDVPQLIQGVEFNGFGDQGVADRHAIHFKQSGNSTGSIVSKNSIRNSNSRCVNIDGTDNVVISDNVAHHTYGHCFAVQGPETGNVFKNNIGVETLKVTTNINGADENVSPATFYISHPTNTWIGNSAAGSQGYGFWFRFKLESRDTLNSWEAPLTAFEDNKSHSNMIFGLRVSPFGYNPLVTAILANSTIYKNRGQGIFIHNTGNVVIDGGYFADNNIAIDVMADNNVTIQNITIVGFSPEYKRLSSRQPKTTPTFCNVGFGFTGIRLHIREFTPSLGLATLSNIVFSDFDRTCNPAVYAIAINPDKSRGDAFNTQVSMRQLSYVGFTDVSNKINFCAADSQDILDVTLRDADGSLNPDDSFPGFIVSDEWSLTGGNCILLVDSCAHFCESIIEGDPELDADSKSQDTPDSSDSGSPDNNSGLSNEGGSTDCVTNPAFELDIAPWRKVQANEMVLVAGFNETGHAMKVSNRVSAAAGGVWQDIKADCMTTDAWYEISADVKMTISGTDNIFDCNPANLWSTDVGSCAGISLFRGSQAPPLKEIAFTVGPYDPTGWAKLYGTFQATLDLKTTDQANIGFLIGRADISSDITVDNISLEPATSSSIGVTNCLRPLHNGDAEIGDHRMWWIFGTNNISRLKISEPGYGGSSYAFRHEGTRDTRNRGMLQKMDGSCFPYGTNWSISAKFKYFQEDGEISSCDKGRFNGDDSCPTFQMLPDGEMSKSPLLNTDTSAMVPGEWNTISSTYTVEDQYISQLYILVTSVNAGFIYELDNIEIVPVN